MSTHVVLPLISDCVCHRAVHGDRADGGNSDDGGHRWGRPCVPGTGSGRMAGERIALSVSTLGSAHWPQIGRGSEVVGRKETPCQTKFPDWVESLSASSQRIHPTCPHEGLASRRMGAEGLRLQATPGQEAGRGQLQSSV